MEGHTSPLSLLLAVPLPMRPPRLHSYHTAIHQRRLSCPVLSYAAPVSWLFSLLCVWLGHTALPAELCGCDALCGTGGRSSPPPRHGAEQTWHCVELIRLSSGLLSAVSPLTGRP